MKKKYSVNEVNICTFNLENGQIKTNLNLFPQTRLCVIDKEDGIAVDVKHELKYDYIETVSGLYFVSYALDKIKDNRRVAVFPLLNIGISEDEYKMAKTVINKLESGYEFQDGNVVLSNEEYLKVLELEKLNPANQKKYFKRKK